MYCSSSFDSCLLEKGKVLTPYGVWEGGSLFMNKVVSMSGLLKVCFVLETNRSKKAFFSWGNTQLPQEQVLLELVMLPLLVLAWPSPTSG